MQLNKFGLGIRFAAMGEQPESAFARKVYEEIFSVLTLTELEGLMLYGGSDPLAAEAGTGDSGDIFLAVIMGGSLKQMRKVFDAIDADAAISMYLTHSRPYIENNRLARVEGLSFYGTVQKTGMATGGDGTLDGLSVPKKRGSRSPVGKGIKVLLAPESFDGALTSAEAIKRLTVAARRHFQGVKLVPVPVNYGTTGFTAALMTACDGSIRRAQVTPAAGYGKAEAEYAALGGKTAVIETAVTGAPDELRAGEATSCGVGELVRRALDEGLKTVLVGVHDGAMYDCGMGFARSLGVKFYDGAGNELAGCAAELPLVATADAEYLRPSVKEARFLIAAADAAEQAIPEGAEGFCAALSRALETHIDPANGFAGVLAALTGAPLEQSYDGMFEAMGMDKLLNGVALVVTGSASLDARSLAPGRALPCLMKRCEAKRIPVAIVAGEADDTMTQELNNAGVMCFDMPVPGEESLPSREPVACFSEAADRMFRFIRIGRDVEKIGAPKERRLKSFIRLRIESMAKRKLESK